MRAVIQRVSKAAVAVGQRNISSIGKGLLIFLGIKQSDGEDEASWLADKCVNLRIFEDEVGRFNRSLLEVSGEALVVSQFTVYAECGHGRRPSFTEAARPEIAEMLYKTVVEKIRERGIPVKTGEFGAHMAVELINEGPVTVIVDTEKR